MKNPPSWTRLYCLGDYHHPLSGYVHKLKYQGQYWQAKPLAALLLPLIDEKPELITCVPLHWRRFMWRGYNQSQHLAWQLASHLQVPFADLFRKIKPTPRQLGMDKKRRRANLNQAFCMKKSIQIKHVAIVDDVVTTGSTLEPLCLLLREQGVERIDIYTLCRTPLPT